VFDVASLTPAQREAATYDGGHLLIVAGAGTGKTTTLLARLMHLLDAGVPPERILLLTFSRRAAAELTSRVPGEVWAGTFHAVASRLLRRHGRALGLEPGFTVLDQSDTVDLLALVRDEIRSEQASEQRIRPVKRETMAAILSRCINTETPLSEALPVWFPWCASQREELGATFAAYTARKRLRQVLDFDDLLLCWSVLLEDRASGPQLQARFDHILVDEYQDTNALQAKILYRMAAGGARVTAVGDDAQAIYSFRAATHRNILEFPDRFAAAVVKLEENHRSTPPLLALTNALIAESPPEYRHDKTLWSRRQGRSRPLLVSCADDAAQANAVCDRILEHYQAGVALRGQAVLFRTAYHSDLLELELAVRRIPFVKYGGLRFLEAAHVKDLVSLLRLVDNPADELAWFRLLQLLEGVGPRLARRLALALPDAAGDSSGGQLPAQVPPAARVEASELLTALADARGATCGGRPGAQIERVRRWLDPVIRRKRRAAAARLADLDQLQAAASVAPDLASFLTELTLDPPSSTSELAGPPSRDDDVLTLSTIHSAKGGEWDVVHVLSLADGCLPSDLSTGDVDSIEEERRLLYVAMTRARDQLYAYFPLRFHYARRGRGDRHGYAQRSRFLTPAVVAAMDQQTLPGPTTSASQRPMSADRSDRSDGAAGGGLAAVDATLSRLWD
jgi:DNA helicase-2/ATP-dependent DNA helicase PcrA